ncbi:MAG: ABC transporter related [Thermotoga sp. 50_1627]|uniref:ABC transporter ATP-binding protein n=1 Tax=Pseudothermotoga sp. TaxID=2033661 RepID=UPI00076C9021|nr:MAG: ABC transporter related [Thermotoga sp. 50_64]KUK25614.1 MAG: ABC transporter related [Thermotoga sp. 50_1627]MBC7115524.1 ABC transporter ATP-binding protein [Pseudothermotoga sp.]HBT40058.1 ABC transporter ATP-binding protein [Pseudothermotoga sp.]HCO98399.1 ABC transporter ATP-binding protein [Pseudothermotoga sp.]
MLEVRDLHVSYGAIKALKGISFKVEKGKVVTLIGSNGAGKTTTLKAICGLVRVQSGNVFLNGENITNKPTNEIVSKKIAMVPEGRRIFPNLTVYENLLVGAYQRNDKDGIQEDMEWIFSLFPVLKERLNQKGGTLSGGEQQMLAIGRALMSRPDLLMLDEPSLGLAPIIVEQLFEVIQKIHSEGKTILLIEQNAYAALNIADYAYVLETGRIVLQGTGKELLANEEVKRAYLGG